MMAEKRDCEGTTEERGNDIKRKRLNTNAFVETRSKISDDTRRDISDDSSSEHDIDPLSGLTKIQRVVLYTLALCREDSGLIFLYYDDVTMGDIDVRKTVEELEERGLVKNVTVVLVSDRTVYTFTDEKLMEISQSYRENCLLSDIDKDFFIDVAIWFPLYKWYTTQDRIMSRDISSPQDSRHITLMRLMMEGRTDVVGDIIEDTDDILLPAGYVAELDGFVQFWENHCKRRNIHPTDWSNGVRDEEMLKYFSTYLILSGYEEEFLKLALNKSKWSILILILMSEKYSILYEEKLLEEKVDKIQQTFLSLNGSDDGRSSNLDLYSAPRAIEQ